MIILLGILGKIKDINGDIRDRGHLFYDFEKERLEIVFHLAAQAFVIDGYINPIETYETNTMGTVNVLDAISEEDKTCIALVTVQPI